MLSRARGTARPVERVQKAYEFAKRAAQALPATGSPLGFLLNEYVEAFDARGPEGSIFRTAYALHDELNEVNAPVYFSEFASHAARHGLRYLADAEFQDSLPGRFPSWVNEEIAALSESVEE